MTDRLERIDWYRRCLEGVQDGHVVRGLAEAKAGYDSAMDELRADVSSLAEREHLRAALKAADTQVSSLHDALYEQIANGTGRDVVNAEIWKCHDILRVALGGADGEIRPATDTERAAVREGMRRALGEAEEVSSLRVCPRCGAKQGANLRATELGCIFCAD